MEMKKLLILFSVLLVSYQLAAQESVENDSTKRHVPYNLMIQHAVEYYFNAPENHLDTHRIVVLVLPACYGTFDKEPLKFKNITVLIVPCIDSASTFFNKELHVLVSLDMFGDRRELIWCTYIWIGKLELNCDNKVPIIREKETKVRKKYSFSTFGLNKNRTKVTSESHTQLTPPQ
jgi:hypothetical protein